MSETNPHESDLILGGQNPPPIDAAILGGLAGVKQRLESESIAERIWALNNAVQYGENAIDLAIQALSDETGEVRRSAKRLLRDRLGEVGRKALLDRETMSYFTTIDDWKQEVYNPEVGIIDPNNNAYILEVDITSSRSNEIDTISCSSDKIDSLLSDSRCSDLNALIFVINLRGYTHDPKYSSLITKSIIELLDKISYTCPNLTLICLGDMHYSHFCNYQNRSNILYPYGHKSCFKVSVLSLLKIFFKSEALYLFGDFIDAHENNKNAFKKHFDEFNDNYKSQTLKTLVIDGSETSNILPYICSIDMPNLEYFQIWIECQNRHPSESYNCYHLLLPILSGYDVSNLKYFGLCLWQSHKTKLLKIFLNAPLIKKLSVLDFQMGAIEDDREIKYLINYLKKMKNLKIIDLSYNCLSHDSIKQLRQLDLEVKTNNQFRSKYHRIDALGYIPF
jgi:hypothetical protein